MTESISENQRESPQAWWRILGVFFLACIVVIARRPGSVFNPQFYAEDGQVFFQDAYNNGWWSSLLCPHVGYFQAVPRIGAALALLVPLSFAPLVLNLIAIAGQALPASLLISSRSARWGSLRYRCLLAATYLVLPNLSELGTNITNVQCFLALSGFLLLVSAAPRTALAQIFDALFLLLFGLSGAYCIFLLPIALLQLREDRSRWRICQTAVLVGTALLEAWSLLVLDPTGRVHYRLGNSLVWFTRVVAGQVYLGVLIGRNVLGSLPGNVMFLFLAAIALCCTCLVVVCAIRASLPMKLFLLFSSIFLAAALVSPLLPVPPGYSLWQLMAEAWGSHYWFFPNLAFAWTLLWCVHARPDGLRVAAGFLLFFMAIATIRDFRQTALKDLNFRDYAHQFQAVPSGEKFRIPINPANWSMWLVKHPDKSR
jgi:hypothetical protein